MASNPQQRVGHPQSDAGDLTRDSPIKITLPPALGSSNEFGVVLGWRGGAGAVESSYVRYHSGRFGPLRFDTRLSSVDVDFKGVSTRQYTAVCAQYDRRRHIHILNLTHSIVPLKPAVP